MEFLSSTNLFIAAAAAAAAKGKAPASEGGIAYGIGYFDLFLVVMVIAGFVRGRSRGMSGELVDLVQWLIIVFGGAFLYGPLGTLTKQVTGFSLTICFLLSYLVFAIVLKVLTYITKKYLGDKLVGSGVFGGFEYYLGMASGVIRFLCIGLFFLALMHSTEIDQKSIDNHIKSQTESFNNVMWPNYAMIQRAVFEHSLSGKFMAKHGTLFLIARTASESKGESIARQRERQVNEAMGK